MEIKKMTLYLVIGCMVFSVMVVSILFAISEDMVHHRNSFLRQFPPHPLTEGDTIDLKYNSFYIAGCTDHHLYLGNKTAPLYLMTMNTSLSDTQVIRLQVKNIESMKFWSLKVKVDSPSFYLIDGAVPVIFGGDIINWRASRYVYDSAYHVDAEPISRTSFAMRSISSGNGEYVLGKEMAYEPYVRLVPGLLEKQIDGRFCVDGMLHYDRYLSRLIYVYYYRNQFIVMDSNLNLAYRGRTIDTISRAQIKVANISSGNLRTMSAPPLLVNIKSCVFGNWLFVNSGLLARNENRKAFDQASVIDVYNLQNGDYRFSFYIPQYAGSMMHDFRVNANKLVVLFDHHVITYNLVPHYFQNL